MFSTFFGKLLVQLLPDEDSLFEVLDGYVATLKVAAKKTAKLLDDIAIVAVEAVLDDPDLREQGKAWVKGLVAQFSGIQSMAVCGDLDGFVRSDAATISLCQTVGRKINIDWQKLLDLVAKYLPIILPIFLAKDQTTDTPNA